MEIRKAVAHQMRNMSFRLCDGVNKYAKTQTTLPVKSEYHNHCAFSGLSVSLFLDECGMYMKMLSYKMIIFTKVPLYDSVLSGCHNY